MNDPWGMAAVSRRVFGGWRQRGRSQSLRIDPNGQSSVLSEGGLLRSVIAVAALPDGDVVVGNVITAFNSSIIRIDGQTVPLQSQLTSAVFKEVRGMSLDFDGNLLMA